MSNKRYSDTINPQIAVQDYLDDLLQKLPSTSPLDKLRQEEEEKAARVAANKKAQQKSTKQTPKPEFRTRPQSAYGSISSNYSVGRETSLAAQRLEKKRALDRASQRDFREPLTIKSSPRYKVMPEVQAPLENKPQLHEQSLSVSEVVEVTESAKASDIVETDNKKFSTTNDQEPVARESIEAPDQTLLQPTSRQNSEVAEPHFGEEKLIAPVEVEVYSDKWLENGRPEWAQGRFECLIFTVAGLKLAVPLVSLGAIHTIDQELTPLVGRPSWFLGLLPVGEKNIRVVDSALWIMPERYNACVKDGYRFVIRLDNSEWGMACDSVAQSFSIAPEEVRWRTDRGKRPWLAGTVIDHMCALMDVAAVAHLLGHAEKTNHSPI